MQLSNLTGRSELEPCCRVLPAEANSAGEDENQIAYNFPVNPPADYSPFATNFLWAAGVAP